MNFADAIRQAAHTVGADVLTEEVTEVKVAAKPRKAPEVIQMVPENYKEEATYTEAFEDEVAIDAMTAETVAVPTAPAAHVAAGNVVRLELFLAPEQLNALFRAVVATQHSVMTLREAAHYLRISANRLDQMAQDGHIPAFLVDGRWRFPRHAVDEWLNTQAFHKEAEA